MPKMPLVSVIIPFYNTRPDFMRESIESVLQQTYSNWEILLVNDGSNASSTATAREYVERYPEKIKYLEHLNGKNRGTSATRQLGIDNSRGKYIAWLDADDLWMPEKLTEQVKIMETYPQLAMHYGRTKYWHSWTEHPQDMQRDYLPENGFPPDIIVEPPQALCAYLRGAAAVPCPTSTIMRRSFVEKVGGHEMNVYNSIEDQILFSKILLRYSIMVSESCREWYRQNDSSMVATTAKAGNLEMQFRAYLDWLAEYLNKQGIKNAAIWHALRRRQWICRQSQLPAPFPYIIRRFKKWILRLENALSPKVIR